MRLADRRAAYGCWLTFTRRTSISAIERFDSSFQRLEASYGIEPTLDFGDDKKGVRLAIRFDSGIMYCGMSSSRKIKKILCALLFAASLLNLFRADWLGCGMFGVWGASMLIDATKSRSAARLQEILMLLVIILAVLRLLSVS